MPPQLRRHTRHVVPELLLSYRQLRIQEEVLKCFFDPEHDEIALAKLDITKIVWTLVQNKNRVAYVRARLTWDTGKLETLAWRVPYSRQPAFKPGRDPIPVVYVPLANYRSSSTLSGARAGSGGPAVATNGTSPRSRPEIGRAYLPIRRSR